MALQHPPAPFSQPAADGFLPTVATGLTNQDRRHIEDALDRSVAANTRLSYASAWRSFEEWTQTRGVPSLPAPPACTIIPVIGTVDQEQLWPCSTRPHRSLNQQPGFLPTVATGLTNQDRRRKRNVGFHPRRPVAAGATRASRRLPPGTGRRKRNVGFHHPAAQGRAGRYPPLHRPRGPDTPRRGEKSHGRHRQVERPCPKTGEAPYRRGPHRGEGHRHRPPAPGRCRKAPGVPGKGQRRGRVDLALLSILRDGLLAGPRRRSCAGKTWSSGMTGRRCFAYPSPRRTRRPLQEKHRTPIHRSSDCPPSRSAGESTPQRTGRHGPGPGRHRRRAASADDGRKVEELQDAGPLHRAPSSWPRRGCQVLPGERGLELLD